VRIALFHNLPSGGAKRHTLEQVKELARRGHEVFEFTLSTADQSYCSFAAYVREQRTYQYAPNRLLTPRVPLVTPYLHAWRGLATLRQLDALSKEIAVTIDDTSFDAVLVKDCHLAMNPYVLKYLKTPSIFQCHHGLRHRLAGAPAPRSAGNRQFLDVAKSIYYGPAKRLFDNALLRDERQNARSASRVLTNSDFSRCLLARYYGVDAGVIYPGINTSVFRPLSLERLEYVLSVGALIYGKGYRFLISALAKVAPELRPPLFIAANSVDPAEEGVVRAMAGRAGVKIHIERIVDDERLVHVYNRARAFVYAPIQEALGMAPLEAMACGTSVLAVREGGVRETVRDGEAGWLVERDEAAFAERLAIILTDSPTRRRMENAGIEIVRRDWTWTRAIDRLERELTDVHSANVSRRGDWN
jgi:glycosyltransferase involved in cell wall biosynthesis